MGGIAGSRLVAECEFQYEIPGWFGIGDLRTYITQEEIWLGTRSISEALTGNDKHFYPLRLTSNGLDPLDDGHGRIAYVYPKEPVWKLQPAARPARCGRLRGIVRPDGDHPGGPGPQRLLLRL